MLKAETESYASRIFTGCLHYNLFLQVVSIGPASFYVWFDALPFLVMRTEAAIKVVFS